MRGARWTAAAILAVAASGPALAQSPPVATRPVASARSSCFRLSQVRGTHPLSEHAVLFRGDGRDIFQMDFAAGCPALEFPDPKLILTPAGGLDEVCHAIDLDVKVGEQGPGFPPEPCIPTGLHRLTTAEIAALPKKDLP